MTATATAQKNTVTLKGSTKTVTEFFNFALSSILYQRGVYPPESFEPKKQYGLTVMTCKDDKLKGYLAAVLQQFSGGRAHIPRRPQRQSAAACTARRRRRPRPRSPPSPCPPPPPQSGWARGRCRRWCW